MKKSPFEYGIEVCDALIKKYKPDIMVAVPRILEAIYEGILGEIKSKSSIEKTIFNEETIRSFRSCRTWRSNG